MQIIYQKNVEGIRWVKVGPFKQIAYYPLADVPVEEIDGYEFPHDHIPELLQKMDRIMPNYFIGCDVSPCLFELH